jgi:uncharacterized protein with GYD domain
MVTNIVLAKFTDQGIHNAKDSPKRADAFKKMAKTFGVTVKDIYWTQGRYDIVTILEAPDETSAMSLSLSLGALGNIRTESLRAFSAADMATIVGKMPTHIVDQHPCDSRRAARHRPLHLRRHLALCSGPRPSGPKLTFR